MISASQVMILMPKWRIYASSSLVKVRTFHYHHQSWKLYFTNALFTGVMIGPDGIKPNLNKVAAVVNWPQPLRCSRSHVVPWPDELLLTIDQQLCQDHCSVNRPHKVTWHGYTQEGLESQEGRIQTCPPVHILAQLVEFWTSEGIYYTESFAVAGTIAEKP